MWLTDSHLDEHSCFLLSLVLETLHHVPDYLQLLMSCWYQDTSPEIGCMWLRSSESQPYNSLGQTRQMLCLHTLGSLWLVEVLVCCRNISNASFTWNITESSLHCHNPIPSLNSKGLDQDLKIPVQISNLVSNQKLKIQFKIVTKSSFHLWSHLAQSPPLSDSGHGSPVHHPPHPLASSARPHQTLPMLPLVMMN